MNVKFIKLLSMTELDKMTQRLLILDVNKRRFFFGFVLLYLYPVLPKPNAAAARLSKLCTTFDNAGGMIMLYEGQSNNVTIYARRSECDDPTCIAAKTTCSMYCNGCGGFDGVVNMTLTGRGVDGSAIAGFDCIIPKEKGEFVGFWVATCFPTNSLRGQSGYTLVLTIMNEDNTIFVTKSASITFIAGAVHTTLQHTQLTDDVSVTHTFIDEVVNVQKEEHMASRETRAWLETSKKAPRRVLLQKSESLLMFFTPKAFIRQFRYSGDKIAEAYRGDEYNHPSVSNRVENHYDRRSRTRQLKQSLPPEPPSDQDPNPYHWDALAPISNLTYDRTLQPIINGPTEVVIQNVSVYLTGVLLNNFNIIAAPTNSDTENTEYQVVLQVDSGSMLIELPPELLPKVRHQVAVGKFWIAIPDEDIVLDVYEWVPGAGIQFLCKPDVCNAALKTLTYGKGLGTGKKSRTVFTILVYPEVSGEAVAVAKVLKICTMDIAGAGAWFTFFQYTKVFYTTSLGVMGMGLAFLIMLCSILGCCVCWQNRQETLFSKHQITVTVEDSLHDETRVFNPLWIPSVVVKAGDEKFTSTTNPKFIHQLQSEHLMRMQSIGVDGTLDAMQFLAAAQAAAASSPYAELTTSEEGGESTGEEGSTTETETTATGASRFGATSSGSIRSSLTSTPKSTRFSLQHESGNTSHTEESAVETPNVSDGSD